MAGRKPKPIAVKKLEGNPGKRKLNTKEPVPAKGMLDCPEWLLPEAKKEWERLADLMNQMGVLTEVDMVAFAAYCQSYARWKEAQEHIDSEGSTFETDKGYQQQTPWVGIANTNQKLMLQAASEFGLTPSSRSRIVAGSAKGKELEDEMEALLGGGGFLMAKEPRPKGYPKLKNYKPSQFMLPTSHYDKKKADRAVTFIENLCHTKGKWAGTPFWLLPWQEQLIRDIFGIVKPDGNRQFRTAFVEICKKVGKSELAAVALYLLYADNEPSAEVYGAAADRQQASIVFDVAKQMVEMSPALMKRSKLMRATKRIVNYSNAGYYQVLSAEVGGKHGFSMSGLVFDEIHTQPNRQLYDVLTKGSSDARQNPLHFIITTAGNDRHSIAYELHTKAVDILEGRRVDPTFYPVVYGLKDDEDWEDEANWYKVNPSLGYTVDIERLRDAYREAKQNPADEIIFKWLRCNMWVSSTVAWIPDAIYMRGNEPIDMDALAGRDCYAGLDLSVPEILRHWY